MTPRSCAASNASAICCTIRNASSTGNRRPSRPLRLSHQFKNMNEYATAKTVVAWWAASRKLPSGMTVNVVSTGSAPSSGFAREAPLWMHTFMMLVMRIVGPVIGMAGSIETASRCYLDAADLSDNETGHFYATAHRGKLVGPVEPPRGSWRARYLTPVTMTGVSCA